MSIHCLTIENLRKIPTALILPSSRLNLIVGDNAAGKTSILESIDYLSRGRTFKVKNGKKLISNGQRQLRVFGKIRLLNNGYIDLGIEKSATETKIRVGGQTAKNISELASRLPVQVMHAEGQNLIEGSPKERRSYLDWGVFHVEQHFHRNWIRYRRTLKQRNAALKSHLPTKIICGWDEELCETALLLDDSRYKYILALKPYLKEWFNKLLCDINMDMSYTRGWPDGISYSEHLYSHLEGDRRVSYTRSGPHNADIQIYLQGRLAAEVASRGQQKLLVAAMKMAQINLYTSQTGKSCIFLIDDLSSELDYLNRRRFLQALTDMDVQIYLTAFDRDLVDDVIWDHLKVFHVEHGEVKELL